MGEDGREWFAVQQAKIPAKKEPDEQAPKDIGSMCLTDILSISQKTYEGMFSQEAMATMEEKLDPDDFSRLSKIFRNASLEYTQCFADKMYDDDYAELSKSGETSEEIIMRHVNTHARDLILTRWNSFMDNPSTQQSAPTTP